jgi:hypothetical protein
MNWPSKTLNCSLQFLVEYCLVAVIWYFHLTWFSLLFSFGHTINMAQKGISASLLFLAWRIIAVVVSELRLKWQTLYYRFIKLLAWIMAIVQSLLIIASRKHYTVDVVVAWYAVLLSHVFVSNCLYWLVSPFRYTVNLVVFFVDNKLPGTV